MTFFDEDTAEDFGERGRKPKFGGRGLTGFFVVLTALFAAVVGWRMIGSGLFGTDGNSLTVAALAMTPYLAIAGAALAVVIAVFRRWGSAIVVFALTAALALVLLPRLISGVQPATAGATLRVMALNMYFGQADPDSLVDLVREHRVDVLVLLELSLGAVPRLEQAGLGDLLPNQVFRPGDRAAGSGLASRYPLEELALAGPSTYQQPSARVVLGGRPTVEVVAVHPMQPLTSHQQWAADLRGLPGTEKQGPVRILAGDFNATLDHAALRRVLDLGYADAAHQAGASLQGTWPQLSSLPPIALDHVLVDTRVAVRGFEVIEVPRSDHKAVLATLQLPLG